MSALADLFTPKHFTNPYPIYAALRDLPAPMYVEPLRMWLIAHYDDCLTSLKDLRLSNYLTFPTGNLQREDLSDLLDWLEQAMIFYDPPQHGRLRGLVHKAFTPSTIQLLQANIQQITDELLDQLAGKSEFDLIADFAYPFPMRVIFELLGFSVEDQDQLRVWANNAVLATEPTADDAMRLAGNQASRELKRYVRRCVDLRREHPGKDLISNLIQAEEAGDRLTMGELEATAIMMILAGHETTMNLIGNGMLALLQHPEQLALLRENPALLDSAIEEMLRYDSPAVIDVRSVKQDLAHLGMEMKQGDIVGVMLGSANHDPQHFENPSAFDITRQRNPHLSFGFGIHFCIGAPLARMEAKIAFEAMLRRWQEIRLAVPSEQLEYMPSIRLRALKQLPLRVTWR
ncbi:MAG: cytochrome P450 [Anaerolineae bacterium]|jgi:cytochrome P450|nr:cytochrome P450 [Anaerolineae bacterium]